MLTVATLLQDFGFLLYGGPMVVFTLLLAVSLVHPQVDSLAVIRTYRAWGPGFGLALGATILGGLSLHWLEVGSFTWSWANAPGRLMTHAVFLVLWVSNIKLEIWTLEPLRKADNGQHEADEAILAGAKPLVKHMAVHASLVVAVFALAITSATV